MLQPVIETLRSWSRKMVSSRPTWTTMPSYHKTYQYVTVLVMGLIKHSFPVLFGEMTQFYWFLSAFGFQFRSYLNPGDSVTLRLSSMQSFILALIFSNMLLLRFCSQIHCWLAGPGAQQPPTITMAEDADMRNELEEMQRRADQLADEVRHREAGGKPNTGRWVVSIHILRKEFFNV